MVPLVELASSFELEDDEFEFRRPSNELANSAKSVVNVEPLEYEKVEVSSKTVDTGSAVVIVVLSSVRQ